jgi:hypothetical protein
MRLPNFLIIGAAKSGTTTIYDYLSLHPDIYLSRPKEPDFFSLDQKFERGIDYYYSLFEQAKPHQICGEASTTYSRLQRYPQTVSRIAQFLPKVKFIFVLRHPVDRAYSFYVHRFKGSLTNPELVIRRNELMTAKTFEEAIQQTSEFIDSSFYLYQIEQYLQYYPRKSFLFLFMEDLISSPEMTIKTIFNFLEVNSPDNLFSDVPIVANQRQDYPESYMKREISSSIKNIGGFKQILDSLPKNWKNRAFKIWRKFYYSSWQKEKNNALPPPMREETRKMLLEKFYEPNQKLAEFLSLDLSHWNR